MRPGRPRVVDALHTRPETAPPPGVTGSDWLDSWSACYEDGGKIHSRCSFQFLDSFAFIVLAAAGLAVIFGIMGVINLAHGEFIMVGAYATTRGEHPPRPAGGRRRRHRRVRLAVLAAVLVTAAILLPVGTLFEAVFLRRLRPRPGVQRC